MPVTTLRIQPAKRIAGGVRVPSDKSLTHRAFMLAALAEGDSLVRRPLMGEDCVSTMRCLGQLGVEFEAQCDGIRVLPRAWSTPTAALDCGNSGTTMRLLAGLLASHPGLEATLTGDASLSRRPMSRIAEPLNLMGAKITGETPPLRVEGAKLTGIEYRTPVASAQIKSAVLLAGTRAEGLTTVIEPSLSRDHTERMLTALGAPLTRNENQVTVKACTWPGFEMAIAADISSAAFWMVAASILPDSELALVEVGVNPTRTGIFNVLLQTGVLAMRENMRESLGEPVADVVLERSNAVSPFEIGGDLVPKLIDEIPVLAVLATQCPGTSEIRDAAELKVKESNRIDMTAQFLNSMGANVEILADGLRIHGPTPLTGGSIDAEGDHRIAMSAVVAGLVAKSGETVITGADSIATSYPEFISHMEQLVVR